MEPPRISTLLEGVGEVRSMVGVPLRDFAPVPWVEVREDVRGVVGPVPGVVRVLLPGEAKGEVGGRMLLVELSVGEGVRGEVDNPGEDIPPGVVRLGEGMRGVFMEFGGVRPIEPPAMGGVLRGGVLGVVVAPGGRMTVGAMLLLGVLLDGGRICP